MQRNRVFISYSHEDKEFLQAFRVQLKPWENKNLLELWSDKRIELSQDWHQEIQQALEATAVAVLLVSPDFLASDYIRDHELPLLLRGCE
jgi:predicted nucleotide-binding protein